MLVTRIREGSLYYCWKITELPDAQTGQAAAKRGQVLFHDQRKFPKTVQDHASTLTTRKLWKAHCQLAEIIKATPGTRRDRYNCKCCQSRTVAATGLSC